MICKHPTCDRRVEMWEVACKGHWFGLPSDGQIRPREVIRSAYSAVARGEATLDQASVAVDGFMTLVVVPFWQANVDAHHARLANMAAA